MISSILMDTLSSSNLYVFAQSNETNSPIEDNDEIIHDPSTGTNLEEVGQTEIDDNESSSSGSESDNDIQSISGDTKETLDDSDTSKPDGDCLFDPSLPKCAPDENGNCPDGFNMNEDGRCFPEHNERCADGYHGVDDDETGRCIPNSNGCPSNMIFRPD